MTRIEGLHVVAQTPFSADGELDDASIESLAGFYFSCGARGLTVLGISGEAGRLSHRERVRTAGRFIAASPSESVIVGVSNSSAADLVELTRSVMALGARGVMIAPSGNLRTEEDVLGYFASVFAEIGTTPVVLQDYPAASGTAMSPATIRQLVTIYPQITAIKHEDFPSPPKLSRLRALLPAETSILTGSNGLYLPLELARGADGPMAGFSFPEVLAKIHDLHVAGQDAAMRDLHDRHLPLLQYEAQGLFGLAVRKELLRRRGAIAHAAMRAPAPRLTDTDLQEIEILLARLGVSL